MRAYKRREQLTGKRERSLATSAGLSEEQLEHLYRLLALAAYDERYVIPKARREDAGALQTHYRDGTLDLWRGRP